MLLNPRRTRTNMKLLQLVWIFLLTLCGQSGIIAVTVKEDGEVILDCSFVGENIEKKAFTWKKDVDQSNEEVFWYSDGDTDPGPQFKGRVFHFPDQLRFGNASIKITKTKTSDSGTYTCYDATIQKDIKSTISLTVDLILKPRPEIKRASLRPFVRLFKESSGVLLQCEVLGAHPEPEVQWWDSHGNVLPADEPQIKQQPGNKYDVILNVSVTRTGDYRCVSTQKEIYHQVYFETFVPGPGGASEPSVMILERTKNGVLLQCVVRGASPELKVFWKNKSGNLVRSKEPQKKENSIILQTTVTKTDYYRCVTTEGKKEVYSEIYALIPVPDGTLTGWIIGLVAALIAGVVVRHLCYKNGDEGSTTDRSNGVKKIHSILKRDNHNNTVDSAA